MPTLKCSTTVVVPASFFVLIEKAKMPLFRNVTVILRSVSSTLLPSGSAGSTRMGPYTPLTSYECVISSFTSALIVV